MANIRSQIKRNRQNERRRLRNQAVRSEVRTRLKSAARAAEERRDDAEELVRLAQKRLDKAAEAGVIHKNAAARQKSRLLRQLHQLAPVRESPPTGESAPADDEAPADDKARADQEA